LLRYSGLRLGDGVTLSRERIEGGRLRLYTAKTGTHVYCPLPPTVVQALKAIPKNGPYFFWTGNGRVKSTVGNWQRALKLLFELAKFRPDMRTVSAILLRSSRCLPEFHLSASRFCWDIKAWESRRCTTRPGSGSAKNRLRMTSGGCGRAKKAGTPWAHGSR